MKSPGIALLWETFARQRWLALGVAVDFAFLVVLSRIVPREWLDVDMVRFFGFQFEIWFFLGTAALFCTIARSPKTGRQGFPGRMFLYPVTTLRLVAYPMLFGMATMALGWLAMAFVVLRPLGYLPPLANGAMAAVAGMAWLQALSWWPFRSGVVRIIVVSATALILTTAVVWPAVVWEAGPAVSFLLLSTYIAAAVAIALRGVALDRRGERDGDVEESPLRERFWRLVEAATGRGGDFRSAARAQHWFEWRTKGAVLVVLVIGIVVVVVAFVAVMPAFAGRGLTQLRGFFVLILMEPFYICWIMGSQFGIDDPARKSQTISPFVATRPMTSGRMAVIKLVAAGTSLLLSYGAVMAMTPLCLIILGYVDLYGTILRPVVDSKGMGFVILVAVLGLAVTLTAAWKGMVGAMLPVLTGRPWVARLIASVAFTLIFICIAVAVTISRDHDRIIAWSGRSLIALPWLLGVLLGFKLIGGVVAFREALRRGMISVGMLAGGVAFWAVMAASAFGLMAILLRPTAASTWLALTLGSALIPPFGRLALTPLALDWNRHR